MTHEINHCQFCGQPAHLKLHGDGWICTPCFKEYEKNYAPGQLRLEPISDDE